MLLAFSEFVPPVHGAQHTKPHRAAIAATHDSPDGLADAVAGTGKSRCCQVGVWAFGAGAPKAFSYCNSM